MKKRVVDRRMYDMAGERAVSNQILARKLKQEKSRTRKSTGEPADKSKSSVELRYTSKSSPQTTINRHSVEQTRTNKSPEKAFSENSSIEQAGTSMLSEQTSTSKSSKQASTSKSSEQASTSKSSEQASTSKSSEQAGTSKSSKQAGTSKSSEQAGTSKSSEQAGTSKSSEQAGTSKLPKVQTDADMSLAEQTRLRKLKRLQKDKPKLKLLRRINAGNLFAICHEHPEFRPLIKSMFRAHEFLNPRWKIQEQEQLIGLFMDIEKIINELISLENNPDAASVMEKKFDRLNRYIGNFLHAIYKHTINFYAPTLNYAGLIVEARAREILKRREKSDLDEYSIKVLVTPKTYLSTRINIGFLIRAAHEHSEFRQCVKTALGVSSAMKYLNYEGQVEVYKVLITVEEYLKQLIHKKYNPDMPYGINVYKTTDKLISSVTASYTVMMTNLIKQCEKSRRTTVQCSKCPDVVNFVRNVNVKPEQLKRKEPENPHRNLKGVVAYANYGISQDRLKNLESLFHHLAAKKGAFRHVWMYKNCVDWFEIASQYSEYKTIARENVEKLEVFKSSIYRRMDECEEVMAGAAEFSVRFLGKPFPYTTDLSDAIALSGELELLVSEAEDYVTTLDRLIRHFLDDWKRYTTLNNTIRKNRYLFLTKHQWKAFDFPLY